MTLAMLVELVGAGEGLSAVLAFVALLPGVDVAMPRQLVPPREGLAAEVAGEGLVPPAGR